MFLFSVCMNFCIVIVKDLMGSIYVMSVLIWVGCEGLIVSNVGSGGMVV